MTDSQYWQERKYWIKLVYGTQELCKKRGLTGNRLAEILMDRYGQDDFVRMTNAQIEDFKQWILQCDEEDMMIFSSGVK